MRINSKGPKITPQTFHPNTSGLFVSDTLYFVHLSISERDDDDDDDVSTLTCGMRVNVNVNVNSHLYCASYNACND